MKNYVARKVTVCTALPVNVFMVLKLTSADRLFHALTEESAMYSSTIWFKKFISISSSMGNRTECKKFVDININ